MKTIPRRLSSLCMFVLAAGPALAQPTVTGFAPASGPANMVVVVNGSAFSPPANFNAPFVLVGTDGAPVISFNSGQLLLTVPLLATSGPISVTTSTGQAASSGSFTFAASGSPPPNDAFSNSQALSGSSGSVSGTTAYATKENGEPNHAGNPGGASVWFSWTAPSSGLYLFDPSGTGPSGNFATGSDFGVLLGIYTGAAVNSLTPIASGSTTGPAPAFSNAAVLNASSGATYAIALDGYNGLMGNYYLTWAPMAAPTVVSFNPSSGYPGQSVTITGTGFAPGATVTFSSAFPVTPPANGMFSSTTLNGIVIPGNAVTGPVNVTTAAGSYTSAAIFTVTAAPPSTFTSQPANQSVNLGGTTSFSVGVSGTFNVTSYQWQSSPQGSSIWTNLSDGGEYSGSATAMLTLTGVTSDLAGAQYQCVVGNGTSTATSTLATLTVVLPPGFPAITGQPGNQDSSAGGNVTFNISATGNGPLSYQWVKTGTNVPGATSSVLALGNVQATDEGSYRVVVSNSLGSVTSNAAIITGLLCDYNGHAYEVPPTPMSWSDAETWAAAQGGHLVAINDQAEQNFLLQTFGPDFGYWIGLSDQSTGVWNTWSDGETVTFTNWASGEPNDANGAEFFATMNDNSNQGVPGLGQWNDVPVGQQFAIVEFPFIPSQPTITSQPQNSTVNAGQNATFTAAATSTGPVTYQWQMESVGSSTWVNLADTGAFSGSATATLTITGAAGSLTGAQFQCVASSGGLTNETNAAVLTVDSLGGFELQSPSETVISGQSAGFAAYAAGTPSPTYQWQKSTDGGSTWVNMSDGNGIGGSWTPTLGIAAADSSMDGYEFRAVATNATGSVTSTPATLTVSPLPEGEEVAYAVTTLAGLAPGSADGTGGAAQFNDPQGAAIDGSGNLYIADTDNNTIRKITSGGVVTTFAGAVGQFGAADGTGSAARFNNPTGVAVDGSGNVYVADTYNQTIRKITPAGVVTTLAGSPRQGGNQDGTGGAAQFNNPRGVAADASGNVYVADTNNNDVRKITPAGVVTTLAGNPFQGGYQDGTGGAALFSNLWGVAVDGSGNVYVSDRNNAVIRAITPAGVVSTLAGSLNQQGFSDGTGPAARFNFPQGIAADASGTVYVADTYDNAIRVISAGGVVSTLAGGGGFGSTDASGNAAQFNNPSALTVDGSGNVYVADSRNSTVRLVAPGGAVSTYAGTARQYGTDASGSAARFLSPYGVAADAVGNVYVADGNNDTIRKVTPSGAVTTLAGSVGRFGHMDGTGSAAQFANPQGVAVDGAGNVYVADSNSNTIRVITPAGVVTTFAGTGFQQGTQDGTGGAAQFNNPAGVAVDGSGNVYVADSNNQTIRKITPSGVVTTLAGAPNQNGEADGQGANARFNNPRGVAVDYAGNVYVADNNGNVIREITPSGVVSTLAGTPNRYGYEDGPSGSAQFGSPEGVAVDGAGNVYVTDTNNFVIREITPSGVVTLAGMANEPGILDGAGGDARFNAPWGIAVDTAGNLYVGDSNNGTVRKVTPSLVAPVLITTDPVDTAVATGGNASFTVDANGTAPLVYQWQMLAQGSSTWAVLADGGEFSGTATDTLSITGATTDLDQAQFECVVSNGTTAVTDPATLTVDFAPSLVAQSQSTTAIAGQSVSFSVGAGGSPGPAYQWQVSTDGGNTWTNLSDGNGYVGTATGTLGISAAQVSQSGYQFRDEASNSSGEFTSTPVTLTVGALGGGDLVAYAFTTLAGLPPGSADGTGPSAEFDNPSGVALDAAGNLYVADSWNDLIRKITPAGVVTTLAGAAGQNGYQDGTGSAARFNNPQGVAVDGTGNVYVADNSSIIRKITPAGVVTTFAGAAYQNGNADGTGTAALFNNPRDVAVDGSGNVYVADGSSTIRKITPAGVVTTLAGNPLQSGNSDGTGVQAEFNNPESLAVDGSGNVYVADSNNATIREVSPGGAVITIAGAANQGGDQDGPALQARFSNPTGVALDASGNIYVVDDNEGAVREISGGVVTTLAGDPYQVGYADGTGSASLFTNPRGVAATPSGVLYVADAWNDTIRQVTQAGVVTTFAGTGGRTGSADGTGSAARFFFPQGVAVDVLGNVYVGDSNNAEIRKIAPGGVVTTLAGSPHFYGDVDGTGAGARFNGPRGMATDLEGNIYLADSNNTIRKVTPAGVVTTVAGNPSQWGSLDGAGSAAEFNNPQSVAVDGAGNIYVADTNNSTIRKITPAGDVTTLAGTAFQSGYADGTGAAAQFNQPSGVAVDSLGNVYVADSANQIIRKVTPAGQVSTLAGTAFQGGTQDGTGSAARFNWPRGVAVDGAGNVYVADTNSSDIRMITPAGVVTTLAGANNETGNVDAIGSSSRFSYPPGLAVDGAGNIYVADANNNTIRVGSPTAVTPVAVTSQPGNASVSSGQNTSFTVAATGTTPFTYQWQIEVLGSSTWTNLSDGGEFSGTATATLSITGATIDLDQAQFQCVVTNGGTSTSTPATLTVYYAPVEQLQSPGISVVAGQSASFSAGFTGSPTPSYQWQISTDQGNTWSNLSDGNGYNGSASATLGISGASTSQSTYQFRVVATNGSGSATSTPATLTVAGVPGGDLVTYGFTTLAGMAPGSADGAGALAQFNSPEATAVDASGNVYVADSQNNTIRKVTPAGVVTTLAGAPGQQGNTDGTGSAARFNNPQGVAVDGSGNVYVADTNNSTIRRITPSGVVTTFAGSPNRNGNSDGTGGAAQFNNPEGVALDSTGNVYVADRNNNTIRKITPAGVVTTLAGTPNQSGYMDGTGGAAQFNNPDALAVDGAGTLYVADAANQVIRRVTPAGVVTTLAGNPNQGGFQDGTGSAARFNWPRGIAVDPAGNVYVADTNTSVIREVTPAGVVTTLAGSPYQQGSADGAGSAARFDNPWGIAVDASGTLYVADTTNNTVRKIAAGVVTTLAGTAGQVGSADGAGNAARFFYPRSVAADIAGNVYVADSNNCTIRKISSGVVTTLAGHAGQNQYGNQDGLGAASRFNNPSGVAVDVVGNVYVVDSGNNTIRKITPAGLVSTLAGASGPWGTADGTGAAAQFNNPQALAVDLSGNVYVADTNSNTIRMITPSGVVTTLAGAAQQNGSQDGQGSAARFSNPRGIAVDGAGNVYVADSNNGSIRKIAPGGFVTTFAGASNQYGDQDGTGTAARFNNPQGLAVDGSGNLYVSDPGSTTIRMVTPAGVVTTLGGSQYQPGTADGFGSAARFNNPQGIAVDSAGNLYVADTNNSTIRMGTPTAVNPATITAQPQSEVVAVGQNTSFTVTVAGTAPFAYEWQMQAEGSSTWTNLADGGEFSGSATATLSITGATTDLNQALFQCMVSNGSTVTTTPATLTVDFAPTVVVQPAGATVLAGQNVSFSVGVGGSPGPSFRWQVSTDGGNTWTNLSDGNGYVGSATATLGISAAGAPLSNDEFRVTATNGSGSATSAEATLTVSSPTGGQAVAYGFTTLAGMPPGSADGTGAAAQFDDPEAMAVDASGNVYIADTWNDTVRKMTPSGVVTTVAGLAGQVGTINRTGSVARFNNPEGIALDALGNIYVSQTSVIRKITPAGVVTTFAGSGQYGSVDGTGTAAQFNNPRGLAFDTAGNLYVADSNNNTIRKVTSAGVVTTLAGTPNQGGSADGTGASARFSQPNAVAVDSLGDVYVADSGNQDIRKVTPAGVVTTLAGTPNQGGNQDGTGGAARFNWPRGITIDGAGNLYVADTNSYTIRMVTPAGVVTTVAGSSYQEGTADGAGSAARFSYPQAVAIDSTGNLYVADTDSNTIRRITTGVVTTVAGAPGTNGSADGSGGAAQFFFPQGVAADIAGNLYVADSQNCTIRKISPAGAVTTLAGAAGNNQYGNQDGEGTAARFNHPQGLAVDLQGNVYVADSGNQDIRKISPSGLVTTLAGIPNQWGTADGPSGSAQFNNPQGVGVDVAGNIYVADTNNSTIRKITPAGDVTTLAGQPQQGGYTDGTGSAARFSNPQGVVADSAGNVYVADRNNNVIRKVTPAGVVTTLAGSGQYGTTDGTGRAAQFAGPQGLAIDGAGVLYVADSGSSLIRTVTPSGVVTTMGGLPNATGTADALGTLARFNNPSAIAVDGAGNLIVADTNNSTIREGTPEFFTPITLTTQPQSQTLSTGATLVLSVVVSGASTTPITYQWQSLSVGSTNWGNNYDGTGYTGSQAATLTISSVTSSYNGTQFRCVVSNGGNTVDSSPATITVQYLTSVEVQSTPETVIAGQTASFSLAVGGNPSPTFSWQESTDGGSTWSAVSDGNGISGSSTDTLVVTATSAMATENVKFRATATNASGSITSSAMALTVEQLPNGDLVAYDFTTLAGLPPGSADGTGAAARFYGPEAVATDGAGDVYVADCNNSTIREISPSGAVTTLAGTAGVTGSADGQGAAASFSFPYGVAVDASGNVFVADSGNNTIRKITPGGLVSTLAGTPGVTGAADGAGAAAQFAFPVGMAVDGSGNLYVADSGNNTIREVTQAGAVTTLAGTAGVSGPLDGTGPAAQFSDPTSVAWDPAGVIYVADSGNSTIRMIAPGGVVSTYAGTPDVYGYVNGASGSAQFGIPYGVAVDPSGDVLVSDAGNEVIQEISASGQVTTLAGDVNTPGSRNGTGSAAQFNNPQGLATDASGNVYVADCGSNVIREVSPAGVVTTFAGTSGVGSANGTGAAAQFNNPHGIAVDLDGNVYVADDLNFTIRKVTAAGVVTTFAGNPGVEGFANGAGTAAQFDGPFGVAVDVDQNVYVADRVDGTIRKITFNGSVSTLAGTPFVNGNADGTGAAAQFRGPHDIAVDLSGNVYVADAPAQTIRKITPAGVVTTFAGQANNPGSADGTGTAAQFSQPYGVAVDLGGNVYVADGGNNTVRKITPAGVVTTLAGTPGLTGHVDGTGAAARFNGPDYIAVDDAGNVYVGEASTSDLRKVTPSGVVTTVGGTYNLAGERDGVGTAALFNFPTGVAVDGEGNLYAADTGGSTIRKGVPTRVNPPTVTGVSPGDAAVGVSISLTGTGFTWATGVQINGVEATTFAVVDDSHIAVVVPEGATSGSGTITIETGFGSYTSGTFTVDAPPTVTALTPWQNVFAGNTASFTVTAAGATSYEWQVSSDGGATWTTLTDTGAYSGSTTATLSVSGVASGMSGELFRAVATNSMGSTNSPTSALTLVPTPSTPSVVWGQGAGDYALSVFTPKAIAGGVADVEVGGGFTAILKNDGTLWTTGSNSNGQLGDGTTVDKNLPEMVDSGVAIVSAGQSHMMYVKTDGTMWAVGANGSGQLGVGNTTDQHSPIQVPGVSGVTVVSAGDLSTLFITSDGKLWAMGDDSEGELCDGGTTNQVSPEYVTTGVIAISDGVGNNQSLFVRNDGSLWAAGFNPSGQLGNGTTVNVGVPVQVAANVTAVSTSGDTMFIKTDGSLWGMGDNSVGELGDGTTINRILPVQVATNVAQVTSGSAIFLKADGTLWAAGKNAEGALCDPAITNIQTSAVQVASGVSKVSSNGYTTMFITTDGTLWAAGSAANWGQLGDGQGNEQTPLLLALDSGAVNAGAGNPPTWGNGRPDTNMSNLFVMPDGTLWLQQGNGQNVQVPGVSGVVDAKVGAYSYTAYFLKGDGTLWRLTQDNTAIQIDSNVIAEGAGLYYVAYIKTDGTLWGLGGYTDPVYGQNDGLIEIGDGVTPTQIDDHVLNVSGSGWHFLYVKSDHTLWGQGTPWGGLIPNGNGLSSPGSKVFIMPGVLSADANTGQNLYVTTDGTLWTVGIGFNSWDGPAAVVDTDVASVAASGDGSGTWYTKADNILRFSPGVQGTVGPSVQKEGNVTAVEAGTAGWFTFLQTAGTGTLPAITTQPQSNQIQTGSAFTLQVAANGSGPLDYQWYKNGAAVSWARTAQYLIPYVTASDVGAYYVIVTNSAGQATSATASLTVGPAVTATTDWQNVFSGNTATFTVTAPGATSFLWQESTDGGTTWTSLSDGGAISGSATAALTVSGVTSAMDGDLFRVVAANGIGSTTTAGAALNVVATPTATGITWGVNDSPTALPVYTAKAIAGGVVDVEEGGTHTAFLKADGTLWATGGNSNGQLGDGTNVSRSTPEAVASGVAMVAAGGSHTMFVKTDGTLWGMGANSAGQLGNGTTADSWTPAQVPGVTGVTAVAAGSQSTLFVTSDGTLWAMGDDSEGELGDGGTINQTSPVQVAADVAAVGAGTYANSNYFVTETGALYAVGDNTNGQLGDGTTTNQGSPEGIVASEVASVRSSGVSTAFLKSDGTLWAMGLNGSGQLGDGTTTNRPRPVQVAAGVAEFAVSSIDTMFVTTTGGLWATGSNGSGSLCDPSVSGNILTPVQVANGVAQVASMPATMFITSDGTLWACGDDTYGELGDGQQPVGTIEVSPSGFVQALVNSGPSSLLLKNDGTVWQQMGGFGTALAQVPGASGAVQIADSAYSQRQLYLKSDGTLWQIYAYGVVSPAVQVASDVVSVGAGLDYFAYIKSDGTLWAQGSDFAIQFGDGVHPVQVDDHVVSLSAAGWYLLYVRSDDTAWGQGTAWDAGLAPNESYVQSIDTPIFLQSGTDFVYGNMGQVLYMTSDGTLWSRGGGFGDPAGPSVVVDTGATTATADGNETLYLKADNELRLRTGSQGTLGPIVDVAGGVVAVNGANDLSGAYAFIQTAGTGTMPSITSQPQSAVIQPGSSLTLQAAATGSGPLSYQWYKNAVAVSWAQAAQYPIPYVTAGDAGTYYVVVTNSAGQATSNTATLSLTQPQAPVITAQPASQTVAEGATATFTVVATGYPAPTYQWYMGGVLIPGATTPTLTLGNVQASNAGSYSVTVSNSVGSLSSNSATLTVESPPAITTQPLSQTVTAGSSVTFTAAATGNPPPTYQWFLGGTPIAGATAASLSLSNVTAANAGTYTLTATNAVGTTSAAATLTVNTAPVITTQPASQTVIMGESVTFTVAATGTPSPSYQWSAAGVPIPGATSSTYTLNDAQPSNAGAYTVTVANSLASITSRVAQLTVVQTPVITTQPVSQTVVQGANVTFSVVATAYPAPTYQWSFNETPIPGATRPSITLSRVTPANAGTYSVAVSNNVISNGVPVINSVSSSGATLTVNVAPAITTQPASQSANVGATVTFTVAATGNPAPTYQWSVGGVPISGATSASLVLTDVQLSSGGTYAVAVSNSVATLTSGGAVLTVSAAPAITSEPLSQTVPAGTPVTFTAAATGSPAPTYQWSFGGVPIPGATGASLSLPAVTTANAGSYMVTATNSAGAATSGAAVLTVDAPPVITTQPASQTVTAGTNATFTVAATGYPAPTYQWYLGGIMIPGATSSSYTLSNVQLSNAGSYSVTATNSSSSVPSASALLSVNAGAAIGIQPVSQTVVAGSNVTLTVVATGNPAPTYQWSKNLAPLSGAVYASLPLYNVSTSDDATYTVTVTNAFGSATSNGAVLMVDTAPAITTQPASQAVAAGGSATFTVVATGNPAPGYQWYLGGVLIPGDTSSTLTLNGVQPANAGSYTVVVANGLSSVTSRAATLSVETAPAISVQPTSQNVAQGASVTFNVVATANPAPTYQWSFNGTPIPSATRASLTLTNVMPASAGNYTVAVTNAFGSVPSATAVLGVSSNAGPVITTQPSSQTVAAGTLVTFTVAATGNPAPTYQWFLGGVLIPGATSSTLTLSDVQLGSAGSYTAVASNLIGSAASSIATLVVDGAPVFTTPPASQTVTAGNNVTFTAVAAGKPNPTYQWLFNGTPIPGATNTTLTLVNVKAASDGLYSVTATNILGSATSAAATLSVNVAPVITAQPASQTVSTGANVVLSVTATGTPVLAYQWSLGGAAIPGKTSPTLALFDVQPASAGNYTVTVTNPGGHVTSHAAVLKVN